jgi:murein DD-endopeptidase MepM/ murein hydrolase activator NlpD
MTSEIAGRRHLPLAAALATAAMTLSGTAFGKCVDDWLMIDKIRDGGGDIELRATNQQQYPITYSVRVRSEEHPGQRGKVVRGSLEAGESESVLTVPDAEAVSLSCRWTIGDKNAVHDDEHLYLLPYARGQSYRVLQGFGSGFSHRGIEQYAVDFKMDVGTPVHAARSGIVARVEERHNKGCWEDGCGRYANFIVVLHDDGTTGEYYHLEQHGALVDVGDHVVAGQEIGRSGNTGHTTMPHLHFAVYRATNRATTQSIPITFLSADGVVYQPRRGHHYLAVDRYQAGD